MYKVLIVEDDPMVAMINEQYVKKNKNFLVVGKCQSGADALEFLSRNRADLLILDVYMPNTDGFELLQQLRAHQLPVDVIMVTAANDREALEKAIHLGVIDYLVKPFTCERFSVALEKFISHRNALKDVETLCQANIDHIIDTSHAKGVSSLPKGIQEKTLQLIKDFLTENSGIWFTGDEISSQTGLTSVTVRRYMNYLAESGDAVCKMDYETGGRPCMCYRSA